MTLSILNKKVRQNYEVLDTQVAGLVLRGTEIKSVRGGKVSLQEAYCLFEAEELWVQGMHIAPYENASFSQHDPIRKRKLLLHRRELRKWKRKSEEKGFAILPKKLFICSKGWAKIEIVLARGKKMYDKREDLKRKDMQREVQRGLKRQGLQKGRRSS